MHAHQWLSLPSSLLMLLLAGYASGDEQDLQWPYNLPPHMKYYPEHEVVFKRNIEVQQMLRQQIPIGMRKMSGDPGEKFLLDYWQFREDSEEEICAYGNTTQLADWSAPFQRHSRPEKHIPILPRFLRSRILEKKSYECPAGSFACTSIGRSDTCCDEGSTCQIVPNMGLGDVGCCAGNQVCGGTVSTCPADYTSCPSNPGGGCCLPGYACDGVGCIQVSTAIVVVTPTPSSTSTTRSVSTPPPSTSSTTTVVVSTPPTSTISSSVPPTTTQAPTLTSPTGLVCSSGFRSCPASLGGGCCPTDRACGRDVCPELSSTNSFSAPQRPTGTSDVTPTTTSSTTVSPPPPGCPTGFYACNAYYGGGCCQTGRNCEVTSCPAGGSITVVDGSTLSVIAPTGSGVSSAQTLLTGSCASGWSSCAQTVGGGCCPSGYACGALCTASAPNGYNATVGKVAPNSGMGMNQEKDSLLALVVMAFVLIGFVA